MGSSMRVWVGKRSQCAADEKQKMCKRVNNRQISGVSASIDSLWLCVCVFVKVCNDNGDRWKCTREGDENCEGLCLTIVKGIFPSNGIASYRMEGECEQIIILQHFHLSLFSPLPSQVHTLAHQWGRLSVELQSLHIKINDKKCYYHDDFPCVTPNSAIYTHTRARITQRSEDASRFLWIFIHFYCFRQKRIVSFLRVIVLVSVTSSRSKYKRQKWFMIPS